MNQLTNEQLLAIEGGLLPPGPGEAERCRAMAIAAYVQEFGGLGQNGLSPQDFVCYF